MHNITTAHTDIMTAYEAIHTSLYICQLIIYIPIVFNMQHLDSEYLE